MKEQTFLYKILESWTLSLFLRLSISILFSSLLKINHFRFIFLLIIRCMQVYSALEKNLTKQNALM